MKFTIGFEKDDIKRLHSYWDEIIESGLWTEGKFVELFEKKWASYTGVDSVSCSSWSGAALAAMDFFNVKGKTVLCPSNTFMATSLSVIRAGAKLRFVDCNREDLCISFNDLKKKVEKHKPALIWAVHIGGHIAFEIDKIAEFCRKKGIVLLEDCAHAHGASWNGRRAGSWGDAGVYSFYATKTVTTGEGGMLVTRNKALLDFAGRYRNYGKPAYKVHGLNYRMSEFLGAIGCVQVDRLDEIVGWKHNYAASILDKKFKKRVIFPKGMSSGYYKYIVFEPIQRSTGKVYDNPCHRILGVKEDLPNTEWIARNHWCVPLYYKG